MEPNLKEHWERVYAKAEINKLGWYEESPEPSLQLINRSKLNKNAAILNVGAGATTLVDVLLKNGYKNVIANDLSFNALEKLKLRLGNEESRNVKWIIDDLTQPKELNKLESVDLWHDRAVLHFFNKKEEKDTYFELLKKLVKINGYVIIAAFNLSSATKCSGLPVYRYDKNMLQEKLGNSFTLIECFDYSYTMPFGELRQYIYTLFKRII